MYKVKDDVDLNCLRKYGFKLGNEYTDYANYIYNDDEHNEYWLIPLIEEAGQLKVHCEYETEQPIWSMHITSRRTIWIECIPNGTYHIAITDMEEMFNAIFRMITDGILEDDYNKEKE